MPEKPLGELEIQNYILAIGVAPRVETLPFTQNDKTGFTMGPRPNPGQEAGMRGYPAEKPGGGSAIQAAARSWL